MTFERGRVELLLAEAAGRGAGHLTLIDPDTQSPSQATAMARAATEGGTDAIMVGGSVGAAGVLLHDTVARIKEQTDLPVILFPSSVAGLCENADAVFFMSLLNSRSPSYLIENQALGAPLVLRYGLEPLPMAYIIIEPGGTVGYVGDARMIPRKHNGNCTDGCIQTHGDKICRKDAQQPDGVKTGYAHSREGAQGIHRVEDTGLPSGKHGAAYHHA